MGSVDWWIRYIGVDEGENVELFYYFVKSGTNPQKDPLILWLTGGPGCSVLSALIYEIGISYKQQFLATNQILLPIFENLLLLLLMKGQ